MKFTHLTDCRRMAGYRHCWRYLWSSCDRNGFRTNVSNNHFCCITGSPKTSSHYRHWIPCSVSIQSLWPYRFHPIILLICLFFQPWTRWCCTLSIYHRRNSKHGWCHRHDAFHLGLNCCNVNFLDFHAKRWTVSLAIHQEKSWFRPRKQHCRDHCS